MTKRKIRTPAIAYDEAWKRIVRALFPEFILFFQPELYAEIEWSRGIQFMDAELHRISYRLRLKRKSSVDVLVRVWRLDGIAQCFMIHVEVQAEMQEIFPRRMFTYHFRTLDRFQCPVFSLAILADTNRNWRPDRYDYSAPGLSNTFFFATSKLLDYENRREELAADDNPFGLAVLAHLTTQQTVHDGERRLEWKRRFLRMLLEKNWPRERIEDLFVFLDLIMSLPEELEDEFEKEYMEMESRTDIMEKTSPLIRRAEARAEARRQRTMILRLGRNRLNEPSDEFVARLDRISDPDRLDAIFDRVLSVENWEELLDRE